MNTTANVPQLWTNLERLSDQEIAALVAASVAVLGDSVETGIERPVTELPASRVGVELGAALRTFGVAGADVANRIVFDAALPRPLALRLLTDIGQITPLAAEVERTYRARHRMLVVDGGVILAATLLLLVLKLKKVQVGKVQIDFSPVSQNALGFVRSLVGM